MKILHVSDLHLGRYFSGFSLEEDFEEILRQILAALIREKIQVLIIAGDIFDRSAPPEGAVQMFNSFLKEIVSTTSASVVMIAGNHDSAHRIQSRWVMADSRKHLIRGTLLREEPALFLEDEYGKVMFSALPFARPLYAREIFQNHDIHSPEDVLKAQLQSARKHLTSDMRWVVSAHAFVSGGDSSQSERRLVCGGVETVSKDIFQGADYVALGHLHRAQQVGSPHIRYCGSPLAFGFDETKQQKSMSLITLNQKESAPEIKEIPFKPKRKLRILKGSHSELLAQESSEDFIKFELSDSSRVLDAMKRLREVFPYACELTYPQKKREAKSPHLSTSTPHQSLRPLDMIQDFVSSLRPETPLSEEEQHILNTSLNSIESEGQHL